MRPTTARRVLGILLPASAVVAVLALRPPPAADADAPEELFSASRARRHVAAIGRQPHALGTAEHARVRSYVAREIEALGLEPRIQRAAAVHPRPGRPLFAGRVTNLLARLPGEATGPGVMLATHYDTVPQSPGASDASAGVAALLETLRALVRGPRLRNDVFVLFTDSEERGLLGAKAFVDEHPWAGEVGLVLNFDARGSRGPAIMFETSDGNGPMIREFRRGASRPVAFSYSSAVYGLLPTNATDFTVFRQAGLRGMNFAFVHGGTTYHTGQDTLEKLDLRSLQHHGQYALELARRFGDLDLERWEDGGDAVYFNLGPWLPAYSATWAHGILLVALAALAVLSFALRRRLSFGGLLATAVASVAGALGVAVLMVALELTLGREYDFELAIGTSQSWTLLGLALVAAAAALAIFRWLRRKIVLENLVVGGLWVWAILAVLATRLAPGASYLFGLPLLPSLVAAFAWSRWRTDGAEPGRTLPGALVLWLALALCVTAWLWAPTLALVGVALGPPAVLVAGIFIVLLFSGPLAAYLALLPDRGLRAPLALAVPGLALVVAVRLLAGYDATNRRPDTLFYALDGDAGEASWISFDEVPDAWTSQFLSDAPERGRLPEYLGPPFPVLTAPAPVVALGKAQAEWLGEEALPDRRTLRFKIRWPAAMEQAQLVLSSTAEVEALTVDGHRVEWTENPVGAGDGRYRMALRYMAPPADGIPLAVELAGPEPLEIEAVGQRYSLPEVPGRTPAPRPADLMPAARWETDSTFVRNVLVLPPPETGTAPEVAPEV